VNFFIIFSSGTGNNCDTGTDDIMLYTSCCSVTHTVTMELYIGNKFFSSTGNGDCIYFFCPLSLWKNNIRDSLTFNFLLVFFSLIDRSCSGSADTVAICGTGTFYIKTFCGLQTLIHSTKWVTDSNSISGVLVWKVIVSLLITNFTGVLFNTLVVIMMSNFLLF
jgi:hypothetical protein